MPVPYDAATRWQPERVPAAPGWPIPSMAVALWRGARNRCPGCGETKIFKRFLKVEAECPNCHAPLGLARADDAPPYFTILIVAHIVVTLMYMVERAYAPPLWVHAAIWLPLTVILALGLLQPIKGATVGLMLKLGMLKTDIDDR